MIFLIVGCGTTDEEADIDQDKNLRAFLDRARERSLLLNAEEMKLRMTEVPYISNLLTLRETMCKSRRSYSLSHLPARSLIKMCMEDRRCMCRVITRNDLQETTRDGTQEISAHATASPTLQSGRDINA